MKVKVKKRSGHWGVPNLFRKSSTISLHFLTKTGQKNFLAKISKHVAQLKSGSSNIAKTLAFPRFLQRQDSKIHPLPSEKNRKLKFLSLITQRKDFRSLKIWNMIDSDPNVLFVQKWGEFEQ